MKGAVQIKFILIIKIKLLIVIIVGVRGCLKQFPVALVDWSVHALDSKSRGESTNLKTSRK